MHFAMMEAVLVLATVASLYRLELAPGYTLKLTSSVTLRPQDGMPMILHQRQKGDQQMQERMFRFAQYS
jgi:cytochrome P450